MYPMPKSAPQVPHEERASPALRALTIDLNVHHDLLAVLIGAVDRLPGGATAIAQAVADLDRRQAVAATIAGAADPSPPLARHFIAALGAERADRATRAAQDRPTTSSRREEDADVE